MHLFIAFVQQFTLEYKNSIFLEFSEIQDSVKNGKFSFKKNTASAALCLIETAATKVECTAEWAAHNSRRGCAVMCSTVLLCELVRRDLPIIADSHSTGMNMRVAALLRKPM